MSIRPGVNAPGVIALVAETHSKWKANRIHLEQLWKECFFRAYSCWSGGAGILDGKGMMEQFYHPAVENMVDTVTAQIVDMALPSDNFFMFLSRNRASDEKADAAKAILRWVHMKNRFKRELRLMVKQAVITGNAPWHCNWTVRKTSVPDQQALLQMEARAKQAMLENPSMQPSPLQIPTMPLVTYAGPDFFTSSIFDYVEDPWPEDPDRCLRIRRLHKSPASVKALADPNENGYAVYENVENLSEGLNVEASDSFKQQLKLATGIQTDYEGKDRVEILECYGDIPVTFGDDAETVILYNHIAVIGNRNTLLRLEPLPFEHGMMPLGNHKLISKPGEPYGTGLVERSLGIHDAILERFNQSIVAHGMAINPMWFYKPDGLFDPEDFEAFPGALFPYMSEVPKPFEVPDRAMDGFHEVALLKADLSECAGSIIDMNTGGERSATETSLVASKGNARFTFMVQDLEDTINIVLRQELSLCQQLLSDTVWVRVADPQDPGNPMGGRELGRADILGEFDIYCVGASQIANSQQRIQGLVQTTAALAPTPAAQRIDWAKYGATLFELQGLTDASSRFFKSDAQVAYEIQQQQALAANGGAPPMAGAGGPGSPAGVPGQPSVAGPAPVPGAPYQPNAQPHPASGPGMADSASAPGRRPLGP